MTNIITRFPPSPTGPLHMGNVRSALFNYFFARQNNGMFVVRVEDTDRVRSKKEYEDDMLDSLTWLGLKRDGELWHQSERGDVYKKYLHKLIDEGTAYVSQETEGENKEVVRFKNPNKTITFDDLIRGAITFDTTELGDFIIARNINEPVYHLAVVIDDFETGVTHVIRGEDHISNTPRQILIQEAIGAPRPTYAHLPLMLAEDKTKLSKRKHGESVSLKYYRERGYLPEAIVNLLALTGWNPGTEEEVLSLDELIEKFDITKVQKGGAVFNIEKLNWLNREYIKRMRADEQVERALAFVPERFDRSVIKRIMPLILDHIHAFGDIQTLLASGDFDFFFSEPTYEATGLVWKQSNATDTKRHITFVRDALTNLPEDTASDVIKTAVWKYAEKEGRGNVLWPFRFALTGKERSPDPFAVASTIGMAETRKRLDNALNKLS